MTSDLCLYALLFEFGTAFAFLSYHSVTDAVLYLDAGSLQTSLAMISFNFVFCFDALSGFFLGILTVALIICFYFLVEYFEYDAGAATIINLSALFSQLALLYFSTFDLFFLILI